MAGLFGGSSSKSNYTSNPVNLQNSAFQNLAGPIGGYLNQLYSSYGFNNPNAPPNATQVNGAPSNSAGNPLAAQTTPNEQALLGQAYSINQPGGNPILDAAKGQVTNVLNPNYPQSLATSPQTAAAIGSAIRPLVNTFNQTTLPGLVGQFTAGGQRVNSAVSAGQGAGNAGPFAQADTGGGNFGTGEGGGKGSSAFDKAAGNEQNNLLAQVGNVAGTISNNAYQTGLNQQTQAITQATNISSQDVNNLLTTLQQEALPRLVQQYGIDQGLKLYQAQVQTILTALQTGVGAAQPVVGNQASGTATGATTPDLASGFGNIASGVAGISKSPFGDFLGSLATAAVP